MMHHNIFVRIYYYFFHVIMLKRIYDFLEKDIDMDSIYRSRTSIKRHNKRVYKLDDSLYILRDLGYVSDEEAGILTYDLCIKRQWGGPQFSKNRNWEGYPWAGGDPGPNAIFVSYDLTADHSPVNLNDLLSRL